MTTNFTILNSVQSIEKNAVRVPTDQYDRALHLYCSLLNIWHVLYFVTCQAVGQINRKDFHVVINFNILSFHENE